MLQSHREWDSTVLGTLQLSLQWHHTPKTNEAAAKRTALAKAWSKIDIANANDDVVIKRAACILACHRVSIASTECIHNDTTYAAASVLEAVLDQVGNSQKCILSVKYVRSLHSALTRGWDVETGKDLSAGMLDAAELQHQQGGLSAEALIEVAELHYWIELQAAVLRPECLRKRQEFYSRLVESSRFKDRNDMRRGNWSMASVPQMLLAIATYDIETERKQSWNARRQRK